MTDLDHYAHESARLYAGQLAKCVPSPEPGRRPVHDTPSPELMDEIRTLLAQDGGRG